MPSPAASAILIQLLHASLQAICPIQGVSVGSWLNVPGTTTVWFDPSATPAQITACQTFLSTYTPPATVPSPIPFSSFVGMFTPAEQALLFGSSDAKIRQWIAVSSSRGSVNVGDAIIKAGLDYLVAQGAITAVRETAIMAAVSIN